MHVFVTGISGQLGFDLAIELNARGIPYSGASSKELDVTNKMAVWKALHELEPDVVIHCAAYTKVDMAEENPELCWAVNVEGTRNIAEACRNIGAKMIFLSTDYVFPGNGSSAYETDDPTGPLNVYGMTKLAGELAVKCLLEKYFIVRTSWVVGINGTNFVKTMLRLAETHTELRVVNDQVGSPTFTKDLAVLLCDMIQTECYGVYHATNGGVCTWAELAEAVFSYAGKSIKIIPVTTEQYGAKALRPKNSRLDKSCLSDNGFSLLPEWRASLEQFLKEL